MNVNREANIGVVFIISVIFVVIGVAADDMRVLALLGVPVGLACIVFSRNRYVLAGSLLGFAALRFGIASVLTGDFWAIGGFLGCAAATVLIIRISAAQEARDENRHFDA